MPMLGLSSCSSLTASSSRSTMLPIWSWPGAAGCRLPRLTGNCGMLRRPLGLPFLALTQPIKRHRQIARIGTITAVRESPTECRKTSMSGTRPADILTRYEGHRAVPQNDSIDPGCVKTPSRL